MVHSIARTRLEVRKMQLLLLAKHYKCKHLFALSYNKKLNGALISETAKQVLLGQKRRKGAPSKAKKALIRQ